MTTTQEHIDGLIATIWHAQLDRSVTNIMVARVLDWLNKRALELQDEIEKGKTENEKQFAEIRQLISDLESSLKGVSTVASNAYGRTDVNARNIEKLASMVNAIIKFLQTGEAPEGWNGGFLEMIAGISEDVDRGNWRKGEKYYAGSLNESTGYIETSHVWYLGCKYRCLLTGTELPPLWNSPDWEFEEGDPSPKLVFYGAEDSLIATGETKEIECKVFIYNQDATEDVQKWKIERDTGSEPEDKAWSLKDKAKNFAGNIDIVYSQSENDLGYAERASFKVTADLMEAGKVTGYLEI